MTSIRKWFINFNDNLTNLTFHSSSNFHYQIVSVQSIQKANSLTSLMSMNSALSLSFINFIYIYHHLFTICTICRTKFHERNHSISHQIEFTHPVFQDVYSLYVSIYTNHIYNISYCLFFKEKSMPLGSPHLRLLLTGMLQEVLL